MLWNKRWNLIDSTWTYSEPDSGVNVAVSVVLDSNHERFLSYRIQVQAEATDEATIGKVFGREVNDPLSETVKWTPQLGQRKG